MHEDVVQLKVPTVSRKIERLINLTIALLATKRYLTKSEIFQTVEGYEGNNEAKERMFERDKDDLRSIGIAIEVGSFDPLFNDEQGYRIKAEQYQMDIGILTPTELSLLSLAATAWQGAALNDASQKALLRLSSLGIASDFIELPALDFRMAQAPENLGVITMAIESSQFLLFDYLGNDLTIQSRKIIPFSLQTKSGYWYVGGVDQDNQEIRTFRTDRMQGRLSISKNNEAFEIPSHQDLVASSPVQSAVIDVRKGKGQSLRSLSIAIADLAEWDRLTVPIFNLDHLAAQVLWHGEDAFVISPIELKDLVVSQLQALVREHG